MGRQSDARERLIQSAAELWHMRSYADVGVSEICEHAGVQKGSFYHFFASKRDLALAVIDDSWERVGVGMMAPILTGPLPPLERFALFFERGMEEQLELKAATGATVGCSFGNLTVELSTVDEVLRERLCRLFDDWAGLIRQALDDAVAAGDLPEMDTAAAARTLDRESPFPDCFVCGYGRGVGRRCGADRGGEEGRPGRLVHDPDRRPVRTSRRASLREALSGHPRDLVARERHDGRAQAAQ